ncbi:MAG: RsiV family protein [Lachnospiraceae bacterium]|nr:RsiV family protein [Lachnospiraceae bacterium]
MKKLIAKSIALAVSGMLLGGCAGQREQSIQELQTENAVSQSASLEQGTSENAVSEKEDSESESMKKEDIENTVLQIEDIENEVTESIVPTIVITEENKKWYTEDGEQLYYASADRVEVSGDGFEALNAVLSEQWGGLRDNYDMVEFLCEKYESLRERYGSFVNFGINEGAVVCRLDDCVASFCGVYDEYGGGSHGYYGYNGATFDVQSGKKLQLEDLLNDAEGFYDKAISYILEKLEENYENMLYSDYEEAVEKKTFGGETPACWYLDGTGIVIRYNLYSIATYASGTQKVTLPYDECAEYIKEDYRKPCSSLVASVGVNEDFSGLIGETGRVMLISSVPSNGHSEVTVVSGDARETVGKVTFVTESYVIKHEDGRSFLVFYGQSDHWATYVYEITGGNVRKCDELDGAEWNGACTGTNRIGLSMNLDVLGTYTGEMVYQLTDDGKLIQTEEIFAVDTSQKLTLRKDLPVTIDGEETTIPAGSEIQITGTDNAGKACFQMDADIRKTGLIQYVRDAQGKILIDGVSETEYFEKVPYSR